MSKKGKRPLHWRIMAGMVLGLIGGYVLLQIPGGKAFTYDWISPVGIIFVRLLKMIAIPLILASLVKGVSDLHDISAFKRIGVRTILIYIGTTALAVSIGLASVNLLRPGEGIPQETVRKLENQYAGNKKLRTKISKAHEHKHRPKLQFLIDMVPDNIVKAMSNNTLMLQVIFFAIFLGIGLILIPEHQARPLKDLFDSLNEVVLKMVDLIMLTAPYAVFALIAGVVVNTSGDVEIMWSLLRYAFTVIIGLALMLAIYMILIAVFAKKNPFWFFKQIAPAQLLAFSSSSSAATLPVTMERVEEHVGVDKQVAGFVLPVGATVNMDGTSLYQAVAAVFILQVLWPQGLGFSNQMTVILTALLASIGAAAVPGAGMIMLVIVLEALGFPASKMPLALALIFAIDRPLDMLRTVINVTGDATVATIVAKSVGKLHEPYPKEWDDYLKP